MSLKGNDLNVNGDIGYPLPRLEILQRDRVANIEIRRMTKVTDHVGKIATLK